VIQGLIFVVDSNDRERATEAREELSKMVCFIFYTYEVLFHNTITVVGAATGPKTFKSHQECNLYSLSVKPQIFFLSIVEVPRQLSSPNWATGLLI